MIHNIVVVVLALLAVVVLLVMLLVVLGLRHRHGSIDLDSKIFLGASVAGALLAIANLLFHFNLLNWLP